jgi:hypothetical protein
MDYEDGSGNAWLLLCAAALVFAICVFGAWLHRQPPPPPAPPPPPPPPPAPPKAPGAPPPIADAVKQELTEMKRLLDLYLRDTGQLTSSFERRIMQIVQGYEGQVAKLAEQAKKMIEK